MIISPAVRPGGNLTTTREQKDSAAEITEILRNYRVVAVVGLSADPNRPSYRVAKYLQEHGYRIVPVNPGCQEILGEKCYAGLRDIPFPVEIVDIFRKVEAIPEIVADAIAVGAKVVWMQQGLEEPHSARSAQQAGLRVVMDRCMKIEHDQRHL
ncbi:MAG TPA: CoA-binding protein [Desulfobaccales bacterium]|nr:CoA-binding protein [Desulfobaccales bacterium]